MNMATPIDILHELEEKFGDQPWADFFTLRALSVWIMKQDLKVSSLTFEEVGTKSRNEILDLELKNPGKKYFYWHTTLFCCED